MARGDELRLGFSSDPRAAGGMDVVAVLDRKLLRIGLAHGATLVPRSGSVGVAALTPSYSPCGLPEVRDGPIRHLRGTARPQAETVASGKTITSIELSAEQVEWLDELKTEAGAASRSAVIRMALGAYEDYRKAAKRFVRDLQGRFDEDAYVVVELDDNFDPFVRIDGRHKPDIHTSLLPVKLGHEDFVYVFIGDPHPTSPVRIQLGLLPLRSGVPIAFPLRELDLDMQPRAVAYFERGGPGSRKSDVVNDTGA